MIQKFIRSFVLIFIAVFTYTGLHAQTKLVENILRLLPADKMYGLTAATRDSILEGKTYYPASNDSDEIAAYNFGFSTSVEDYLYISMSYETGQRASGMIELRTFKMPGGNNMVLVSQTAGVWQVTYQQEAVSAFIYNSNKKLVPCKKKIFPAANESLFMKAGIPDPVKKEILSHSNMTFDLSKEKFALTLNSNYISGTGSLRKWLKGDCIYFNWVKDHFEQDSITFE